MRERAELTFDEFLKNVCPQLDLNWRKYRRRSARRNVEARIREIGLEDFASYRELIEESPAEAAALPDLMRVTVSRFFRERDLWEGLVERALPPILEKKPPGGAVRAWSAGCCSGEEPYTLAIIWTERLQPLYKHLKLEIIGTDIDENALKRAEEARYFKGSIGEVPAEILDKWFLLDRTWNLKKEIKQLARFEWKDLLKDPPPAGMDIVLCRYLAFTYYSGGRLLSAAERLRLALVPGGILMIGGKESLPPQTLKFFRPMPGLKGIYERS